MSIINKKIVLNILAIIVILMGAYFGGKHQGSLNAPINSNNKTYRIYAQNAIINDNGQLTINGIVRNTVTGDAITFTSESIVELAK